MILYSMDNVEILSEDGKIFLVVKLPGIDMKMFSSICNSIPRLKITKFGAVQNALDLAANIPVLIGNLKEKLELQLSNDEMIVYITLNITKEQYEMEKKGVVKEIFEMLKENDITEGIKKEIFNSEIPINTKVVVAEGIKPIHGKDAILTYYEFNDNKPIIKTDGKVNHYELNLINNVLKGEWLGKKIPATSGKNGISIKNNPISAKGGRDYKLKYDKETVKHEILENGEENLYAVSIGAVKIIGGKVFVDNHLIINGDVEYSTGNIEFDGYVTITGTVKDKFSVTATYDISINGQIGIGKVNFIKSQKGSIVVKGGINGKGEARIIAARDVFTKYVNEATIEAGGVIHIGFYAMDAKLSAEKIILPPLKGRIIGGEAIAEHRIEVGSIGNKFERPTKVSVEGFEREDILENLEKSKKKNEIILKKMNTLKRELEIFETNISKLDGRAMTTYEYMMSKYEAYIVELSDLAIDITKYEDVLKTRGEGEVTISQSVYPKTILEIKNMQKRFKDKSTGSFYVDEKTFCHRTN